MERLDFKSSGMVDEIETGFMSGKVKGFQKFTRTKDGKEGVIYSDGLGNMKEIQPEDIIWDSKTEFTTKSTLRSMTIIRNQI